MAETWIAFAKRFATRKCHRPITEGISTRCYGNASYVTAVVEWTNHTSAYWHLNRVSSLVQNSKRRKRQGSHFCGEQPRFLDEGEFYIANFDEIISVDKSFTQVERLSSEVLILSQFELVHFHCSRSCLKLTYNGKKK